jgi:CRISPR-associated protein, TM1812 family
MAKILISSLGMGDRKKGYQKADYAIDDKIYRDRTFISSVLCEHIGIDKLFLVGTKDSIWESVYEEFGGDSETAERIYTDKETRSDTDLLLPVEQQIETKLGSKGSKCFIIKYGLNEDELWLNFDKYLQIMSKISKDDEVYLDITHSFRSLSLMSFVMSEFYVNTRDYNLNIKGVYYGMFEASRKNDGTKIPAPIVDLKMLFEILEWSRAIKNLKFYGNGYELMALIDKSDQPKNIKNSYEDFSYALSMSDIGAIQKSVKSLSKEIFDFSDPKAHILKIIAKDIKEFIDIFKIDKLSDLQIELASWYAKNKNFAMAYMTLAEAVPSLICEQNGKDPADRDAREDAKHTLGKCKKENYNSEHKKAAKIYFEINNIRVNIAHKLMDGDRRSNSDPQSSTDNIWEYIEKVKAMGKIHFKLQKRPPKK